MPHTILLKSDFQRLHRVFKGCVNRNFKSPMYNLGLAIQELTKHHYVMAVILMKDAQDNLYPYKHSDIPKYVMYAEYVDYIIELTIKVIEKQL